MSRTLPWEPIITIEQAGIPEITLYGTVSIWSRRQQSVVSVGNTMASVWTHEILAPWLLACQYPILKAAYPQLQAKHFALMMSSHNGEALHRDLLHEILLIGNLLPSDLKCPARYPNFGLAEAEVRYSGSKASAIYHPNSGRHLAMLLTLKAQGQPIDNYLDPAHEPYQTLKHLLRWLLGNEQLILETALDSCGMPMLALTAQDIAKLYQSLLQGVPEENWLSVPSALAPVVHGLSEITMIIRQYPYLLGGTDRLDTLMTSGQYAVRNNLILLAKESLQGGMMAIGTSPFHQFPVGIGVFIKLASAYHPLHLELLSDAIFESFNLKAPELTAVEHGDTTITRLHFALPVPQRI